MSKKDHYRQRALNEFLDADEADAWLVAYALEHGLSIVTYEVRGQRIISSLFQARDFSARQGARREHSRGSVTDEQRGMAEKDQHQMGKLLFAGPLVSPTPKRK